MGDGIVMGDLVAQMGGVVWTVLSFIVALSIIVGVHEYGHYIVGRWSGIRAEVFSLGFGPRLWSRRDRRGTVWQIAAIPAGGYVRFLGDDNAASAGPGQVVNPRLRRQTLGGAPLWARFATVAAGPVFNFILAALVFGGVILWQGMPVERVVVGNLNPAPPGIVNELRTDDEVVAVDGHPTPDWPAFFAAAQDIQTGVAHQWTVRRDGAEQVVRGPTPQPPRIAGVAPRSAAATAGLKPGDVILSIDGNAVTRFADLRDAVEAGEGAPLLLRLWRPDRGEFEAVLAPRRQDLPGADGGFVNRWLIGVTGGEGYVVPATRRAGLLEAARLGAAQTWGVVWGSLTGIAAMITGEIGRCNLSGAISIAEVAGQAASTGVQNFFWLIGVLSAGIGFLNLLPIPVLDGGHLAFYSYEAIRGRPPSDRIVGWLSSIGMALVLALMIFGLSNDILCR